MIKPAEAERRRSPQVSIQVLGPGSLEPLPDPLAPIPSRPLSLTVPARGMPESTERGSAAAQGQRSRMVVQRRASGPTNSIRGQRPGGPGADKGGDLDGSL